VSIELKKEYKYSLVVPTSMGVRLTPINGQPMHTARTLIMQATSAETNVASVASFLGLPVKVLTTFVKDSPIAQFIKERKSLRADHGVIAISLTWPIAAMAAGDRGCIMTVPARLAGH
jgi:2-dehydro-3-deoxygluconokinase